MPHTDVDQIACTLGRWGALAAGMPPSWRRGGISVPLRGPNGQHLGRMLPGRGFALDCDLRVAGITRRSIPHVYERSLVRRAVDLARDLLRDERGVITTIQGIKAAILAGQGQTLSTLHTNRTPSIGANQWGDLFCLATDLQLGTVQAYTSVPGGQTYDATSPGVFNFGTLDPNGSNVPYLLSFGSNLALNGNTNPDGYGLYLISDLLVACGGIPIDTTTPTTVNTVALPRYTTGAGVMLAVIATVGVPTGNLQATISYTNQGSTPSRSSVVTQNNQGGPGQQTTGDPLNNALMQPWSTLQAGDYGVQSVQTYTQGGADTAGNQVALELTYPLLFVPGTSASDDYFEFDTTNQTLGLVEMATSSGHVGALTVYALATGNVASNQPHAMTFKFVQG